MDQTRLTVTERMMFIISQKISRFLGGEYLACRPAERFVGDLNGEPAQCIRFGIEKTEPDRADYIKGDKILGYVYITRRDFKILYHEFDLPFEKRQPKNQQLPNAKDIMEYNYDMPLADISLRVLVEENIRYFSKYYKKYPFIGKYINLVATVDPDTDLPAMLVQGVDSRINEVTCNYIIPLTREPKAGLHYSEASYFYEPLCANPSYPRWKTVDVSLDEKFENAKVFTERISMMGIKVLEQLQLKENEDLHAEINQSTFFYVFQKLGMIPQHLSYDPSYHIRYQRINR